VWFLCLALLLCSGIPAARAQGLLSRHRIVPSLLAQPVSKHRVRIRSTAVSKPQSLAYFLRSLGAGAQASDPQTTPFMARLIRQSYASLARYAEPSGKKISFHLSNFRTLDTSDFDRVRWLDLVTMPGGEAIQVESRTHQASDTREGRVEYIPKW